MSRGSDPDATRIFGRYALFGEIACGGMATVHVGRLMGPVGFTRVVAVKRLHRQYARDPEFVAMFMDEARLAARIRHPNVVPIIDVVATQGELLLVMDYIEGDSLGRLLRTCEAAKQSVAPKLVVKIMSDVLSGLHAAHEMRTDKGEFLGVVHRDVSPQNVMVGVDGVAHLIDFGVAKAAGRVQATRDGQLKGKLPYMSPEQIRSHDVDRRTDIYAASAVLWEALTGQRLFQGDEAALVFEVLRGKIPPPSTHAPGIPKALDDAVMRGLARNPQKRFSTALEMADALESALAPATARDVARWIGALASESLQRRAKLVAEVEGSARIPAPSSAALEQLGTDPSRDDSDSSLIATAALIAPLSHPSTPPRAQVPSDGGLVSPSAEDAVTIARNGPSQPLEGEPSEVTPRVPVPPADVAAVRKASLPQPAPYAASEAPLEPRTETNSSVSSAHRIVIHALDRWKLAAGMITGAVVAGAIGLAIVMLASPSGDSAAIATAAPSAATLPYTPVSAEKPDTSVAAEPPVPDAAASSRPDAAAASAKQPARPAIAAPPIPPPDHARKGKYGF